MALKIRVHCVNTIKGKIIRFPQRNSEVYKMSVDDLLSIWHELTPLKSVDVTTDIITPQVSQINEESLKF